MHIKYFISKIYIEKYEPQTKAPEGSLFSSTLNDGVDVYPRTDS